MVLVRQYCITRSPGFAGVALLPQYYLVDPKDENVGDQIAFTDGYGIYLCEKFFKETPKAQAFILIHEVMHVALRHPQRGLALRKKRINAGLPWSSMVYNWAVDAIVNFALQKISSWAQEPSVKMITFESLLKAEVLQETPPHHWSAEKLFTYLMDELIMPKVMGGLSMPGQGDQQDQTDQAAKDWAKDKLPKGGGGMLDIEVPLESGMIPEETQADARNWEGRLKRAAAGDRAGGVMKEILFDIPTTKTPWRHILRRFIADAVMPQTQIRPSKPNRQNIALTAFKNNHRLEHPVPFTPAYQPKAGIRKIVVVIDTSGSITDELCEYFAGELQMLRSKLGSELTVITCDTEVHQTMVIQPFDDLRAVIKANSGFKGRGGTDFRPGVAAAEKIPGAAVIVYLTDMMGPYPEKCRVPLLWASICESYTPPPCGRVVVLEQD
jgi:predicted metal-dependent peptidase